MYRNTVLPEYVFKAYVGDYVDLKKMREVFERASVESTFAGFMNAKREAEFEKLLKKIKQNSVDVEVAVTKAVAKTLPLRSERIEVVKTMPKKPDANDVIVDVVHGRIKGYDAVRRLIEKCRTPRMLKFFRSGIVGVWDISQFL
jgi:DNA replicative helicase MCM subunit Mcm2 (Cdc46/Mcm family)